MSWYECPECGFGSNNPRYFSPYSELCTDCASIVIEESQALNFCYDIGATTTTAKEIES